MTKTVNVFASVGTGAWETTGFDMASANINGYQLGTNYVLSKRTNLYASGVMYLSPISKRRH